MNYIPTFNRYYMRGSSYFTKFGSASDGLGALRKSGMCGRPRTPTVNKQDCPSLALTLFCVALKQGIKVIRILDLQWYPPPLMFME